MRNSILVLLIVCSFFSCSKIRKVPKKIKETYNEVTSPGVPLTTIHKYGKNFNETRRQLGIGVLSNLGDVVHHRNANGEIEIYWHDIGCIHVSKRIKIQNDTLLFSEKDVYQGPIKHTSLDVSGREELDITYNFTDSTFLCQHTSYTDTEVLYATIPKEKADSIIDSWYAILKSVEYK